MMLENILINFLTSLCASGLVTIIRSKYRERKYTDEIRARVAGSLKKDDFFLSSINDLKDRIKKIQPPKQSEKLFFTMIQMFLESTDTESIIRQIYSESLTEISRYKSIKEIQEEFLIIFANHLRVEPNSVKNLSEHFFNVINTGCKKALNELTNQNILSAYDAKSLARHRALIDEIKAGNSNYRFLAANPKIDLGRIRKFEEEYRMQIRDAMRKINTPHIQQFDIMLNDIFVTPTLFQRGEKKSNTQHFSLDEFLNHLYRAVVLGDPGGGKSTLAQKICYELSKNYKGRLVGGRLLTPVLVILKKYSNYNKKGNKSIAQFINDEAVSIYQLSTPPSNTIEYLLHNGHLFIIFDGLDELIETNPRREVSRNIELFCNLYSNTPVLVTSRIVGYEKASLDSKRFEKFFIDEFSNEQIKEYVKKWFKIYYNNDNERESSIKTKAFLEESKSAPDIRRNPLMLSLMCNLYKRVNYIPQNRPELYKACSEMLFKKWDKVRDIWIHLSILEPEFLVNHLANWVYSTTKLYVHGIVESDLIDESIKFLCSHGFESFEKAKEASEEFLSFCRNRSWVFTDFGLTPEGENIYKFTHNTFLEYYTACNIVRNFNDPIKLWDLLGPKIAMQKWDMIAQLAFQMIHKQVAGSSDKLIELIVKNSHGKSSKSGSLLSFGIRSMQFISPHLDKVRLIVRACIEFIVGSRSLFKLEFNKTPIFELQKELILGLFKLAPLFPDLLKDEIKNNVIKYSKNKNEKIAISAIDFGLTLTSVYMGYKIGSNYFTLFRDIENEIIKKIEKRLTNLAPKYFRVYLYLFYLSGISLEKFFSWYKCEYLFCGLDTITSNFKLPSISSILKEKIFSIKDSKELEFIKRQLSIIGHYFLNTKLPCFIKMPKDLEIYMGYLGDSPNLKIEKSNFSYNNKLDKSKIFLGLLGLRAVSYERKHRYPARLDREEYSNPIEDALDLLIECRYKYFIPARLYKLGLSSEVTKIIEKWLKSKISFSKI